MTELDYIRPLEQIDEILPKKKQIVEKEPKRYGKEFQADNLYRLANKILENSMTESECRKVDVTDLYRYEITQRIVKGELINMNFNGTVRKGKSTAALAECLTIKQLLEKVHRVKRPLTNANVCRDQNEYSRIVKKRPNDFKHECDVIDEWAEMEEAGYNATIEQKYLKDFSDRQAGRYYHRIACSPHNITDPNTDIIVEIIAVNKETKQTLGLLYYRMSRGESVLPILLGHIKINVAPILGTGFYHEYLRKKEEKWELMNKHNIMSPRQLEYAKIIIATYDRIKQFAEFGLTQKKHFKTILQEEADKRGVWFSILGDKDVLETLEGMTEITELIHKLEVSIKRAKSKGDVEEAAKRTTHYEEIKRHLGDMLKRQHKMSQLWDAYQRIDETGPTPN